MSSEKSKYPSKRLRVLELFAGIGGLHWGLKVAGVPYEIVAAMEINPTVLEIYRCNFSETNIITKNLEGITAEEINEMEVDAIVMSPPCQPFCRTGNRLDLEDKRTNPLSQITKILKDVQFSYIFVENVQGFETSSARENLLAVLKSLNFTWQEFMLNPKTLGVPNSRLRYYLIGKQHHIPWAFQINDNLMSQVPNWDEDIADNMPFKDLKETYEKTTSARRKYWKELKSSIKDIDNLPFCVGDIIDWDMDSEAISKFKLSNSTLTKYYQAMDIVTPSSTSTCCFTKGYGHFIKGTGSVLSYLADENGSNSKDLTDPFPSLRYFTPKEISRLMCYPEEFKLPQSLSSSQMYKALGNSVNVYAVAVMFSLLFSEKEVEAS